MIAGSIFPYDTSIWSPIIEMMQPVTSWGKSFYTVPFSPQNQGDIVRIVASENNTSVRINGVSVAQLNRGQFIDNYLAINAQIETSAPALVAQFFMNASHGSMIPGPFMVLVTPTAQFTNQSVFSTPPQIAPVASNYLNVIAPTSAIGSMQLDNQPISSGLFTPIGTGVYSGARILIPEGTHVVKGGVPFGSYVYGVGRAYLKPTNYSYGFPGERSFQTICQLGDPYSPGMRLTKVGDTIQGVATDSEDISANGILDPGEDLNGNGLIDRRSEDLNGNGILDPGDDLNGDGILDKDTGVFKVELDAGASNLKLEILPFVPGASTTYFSISLVDPKLPGNGFVLVADGAGNVAKSPVSLSNVPVLKDVRVIDTISTINIDIDNSSFSRPPYSITGTENRTIIEWRFDTFSADSIQDIGLDLTLKNPLSGEQRLISHRLELIYIDTNSKEVRTELDSQFVRVLSSAFDSTITPDKSAYRANENVLLPTRINNLSEYARTVDARITVEDGQGITVNEVALLPNLVFAPGMLKELANITFNTGSILAGDYKAHLFLSEKNKPVGEAVAIFKIEPTITLNSKVTTDKASYAANERVVIKGAVQSLSPNCMLSSLTAKLSIVNDQGQNLFTDVMSISQLAANQTWETSSDWNSAVFPRGGYTVKFDVFDGATLLGSTQSIFEITGSTIKGSGVSGTVSMQNGSIEFGGEGTISFSLTNKGNEEIPNATVKLLIVDPDSTQVIRQFEPFKGVVVPMGGSLAGQVVLPAEGLTLKNYLVVMQLQQLATTNSVASTSFAVKDTTPPVLSLVSPEKDTLHSSPVNLSVIASDTASGMERVEYQMIDGVWNSLPVEDPVTGKYAASWQPTAADNGTRTATFRGFDLAGNESSPVSVTFKVDTIPPSLNVSTLSDGSFTNVGVLNVSGSVSDENGVRALLINSAESPLNADGSFSRPLVLNPGANPIEVMAVDFVNNQSLDTRTINLDQQAPGLTIDSPADNAKTAISPIEVRGSVDENSTVTIRVKESVQAAAMNGAKFSATVIPEPGWNTIEVTATDLAGNTGSQKRSVLFDDQVPSLSISEPPQDIRTNKSSLSIAGTANDPYTGVGITVSVEGNILTPPVIDGTFSQVVSFAEEKLYPITVTATNEVGTQVVVQRNIIYDHTPPMLTFDPVVTPTNAPGQVVTGTREEGGAVTVSCPSATLGTVEYPTSTTWRLSVSGLGQGENRLLAETVDLAGNRTSAVATILYVPRAPEVTISASPNQLWPPNKKMVPVVLDGSVITYGSEVREMTISVADEYGVFNQQGLKFGDTVLLEAWRDGNDKDGRVYTVTAVVKDQAGNVTTRSATVVVPHDMGK